MALSDLLENMSNQRMGKMPSISPPDPMLAPPTQPTPDQGGSLQSLLPLLLGRQGGGGGNQAMDPGDPSRNSPRGWISAALDETNKGNKWMDELYQLMMGESGGDPRAVNDVAVDSGEHAKGLFQMIPSTFRAHNIPGLGGIFNPVANASSAIRYIWAKYGNPNHLPTSGGY